MRPVVGEVPAQHLRVLVVRVEQVDLVQRRRAEIPRLVVRIGHERNAIVDVEGDRRSRELEAGARVLIRQPHVRRAPAEDANAAANLLGHRAPEVVVEADARGPLQSFGRHVGANAKRLLRHRVAARRIRERGRVKANAVGQRQGRLHAPLVAGIERCTGGRRTEPPAADRRCSKTNTPMPGQNPPRNSRRW